jgi:hypothetical protein
MYNASDFGLDPRSRRARVKRIAVAVAAAWKASASEAGLKSTLREYRRGVVITETGENHAVITLIGELPNMLERGIPPHDMRSYLLKTVRAGASPIRRVKKGPRRGEPYRYIMFRRSTSEIKKMGGASGYRIARGLEPTTSGTEGGLLYGGRMSGGLSRHYLNKSGVRSVSDALTGMVKLIGNTTQAGAQNRGANVTYAAWRTVSTLRPEAWQHSGFKALNLASNIALNVNTIAEEAGL